MARSRNGGGYAQATTGRSACGRHWLLQLDWCEMGVPRDCSRHAV